MKNARRRPSRFAAALFAAALAGIPLSACQRSGASNAADISGAVPPLALSMTRADDGRTISAADYKGKVTLMYFGYTFCPDICPMTLSNVARVLKRLGPLARDVRVLFVTVDPDRDTPDVLKQYVSAFGPEFDGLRGDPDHLAALARRYRVAYSVDPHGPGGSYQVTHGSGIYVFDRKGKARLLMSSLSGTDPDIDGATADLRTLLR